MMNQQGVATARFGEDLAKEFGSRYVVYYDHGNPDRRDNVAACKAFYGAPGEGVHNVNRLADVDALLADSDGRALVLIEIEERPSSPKKILGDIFALAMSNHVAVGRGDQKYFAIGAHTRLVIAGVLTGKGASREKVETLIAARLSSFHREKRELSLGNVRLVFRESIEAALKDAFSSVEAALLEARSAE
ncbi:MAG: hypothetical protein U9R72_07865 [Chloroflexota bacterium]|nr:hypothetical protein [Chloroflexota bacterium]